MRSNAPSLRLVACVMVWMLLTEPFVFAFPHRWKHLPQMETSQRALHLLNRFTFGPRPGDLEAVQALGPKRWFERQLNPASIDDSTVNARLAAFPAMQLSQQTLMQRYPSPQVLRIMEKQKLPLPSDPAERALYAGQMAFYRMAQAKKAAKGIDVESAPTPATHEEQLYSGLEVVKIVNLPPEQRMARILALSPEELIAFHGSLSKRELADTAEGLTPEQKEMLAALPGSLRMVSGELLQSRLLRDIYSDRQLEAVMTDFWLNHFNIYSRKDQNEPFLLPAFEREVIRPNALGNFETLLVATAKSPAMLTYLDNWQSIGPTSPAAERTARNPKARPSGLNENYARELMELHTLGVNGGYTQADVTQVAKVFTGWTIEQPLRGAAYQFEPKRHEPGPKQILGTTIQSGGEDEGLAVLHLLATSQATAKFIATKLAIRFVADDPPPALVDRMARAFLASHGDIKTVLRTLFDAPEFWSPQVYRAKVKTPLEFVVSAARATNAQVANAQPLVQALDRLGMPLYGMPTPNGYSWLSEPWVSTGALVNRMNFALSLASDKIGGTRTGLAALLNATSTGIHPVSLVTPTDALAANEQRLELLLLGQPVSDRTRHTVLNQAHDNATQPNTMAGLLLGSPEFQRR